MSRPRSRRTLRLPPPIPPGGRIAVVAPGSSVRRGIVREGIRRIEQWGYEAVPGRNLYAREGDLAGSDEQRAADLHWALTEPGLDAVWAARGGWGSARLLEGLDWKKVTANPRWMIGFSDLTALMGSLLDRGIPSWHAPLVADLANPDRYVAKDLKQMLVDPLAARKWAPGRRRCVVPGRAEGVVVGGCLSLLSTLAGTPWQPDLRGGIVFLEEVGEAPYRVDRLLWQAHAAGVFRGVKGLLFGQFVGCRPLPGRPSRTLVRVLSDFAEGLGVPALAGIPAGHGRKARALPIGYGARLDASAGRVVIGPPESGSR